MCVCGSSRLTNRPNILERLIFEVHGANHQEGIAGLRVKAIMAKKEENCDETRRDHLTRIRSATAGEIARGGGS